MLKHPLDPEIKRTGTNRLAMPLGVNAVAGYIFDFLCFQNAFVAGCP